MNDFDYKKYSLENLEKWMRDALTAAEATPQEIYDVIKGVVDEEYHYYKHQTGRCYELLALLNCNGYTKEDIDAVLREREYYEPSMPPWGHSDIEYVVNQSKVKSCDKDDKSPECQKAWNDFWEDNYYPEESSQYTEEELNAMCDKAASDEEKNKCREYNLREEEYYDKRVQLDAQQDKVVKWQLPVEVDGISGEYYVQFPDDLMEAANIKEDDLVEWIDRKDGSFELRKVSKPISIDEC
jgi:hypothetical protein